jgi:endoglucanase
MREESFAFLKHLVETPSPSGFEQRAQAIVREEMRSNRAEVRTDVMGNVIGVLNPKGRPRVMLAGHCDEIGLMVRFISEEGYIHFVTIGGVDPHLVPGKRVTIHNERGPVLGVAGKKAIHIMDPEERKKVMEFHQQWIDIGAKNKAEAEKLVAIGDPMTFTDGLERMNNELVVARAFDDRMGSFVVAETVRLLSKQKFAAGLYAVSTVQEEIGLRGAAPSAFGIEPDVAIAIDVTHATDYPEVDKKRVGDCKLGLGPVLHRGANINPTVGRLLVEAARAEKIPHQMAGDPGATGTDAWAMQIVRSGIASGLLSVPLRYMHTPSEVLSLKDLENASRILAAFIKRLKPKMNFIPEA